MFKTEVEILVMKFMKCVYCDKQVVIVCNETADIPFIYCNDCCIEHKGKLPEICNIDVKLGRYKK